MCAENMERLEELFSGVWEVNHSAGKFKVSAEAFNYPMNILEFSKDTILEFFGFVIIETENKVSYKYAYNALDIYGENLTWDILCNCMQTLDDVTTALGTIYSDRIKWPTVKNSQIHYALGVRDLNSEESKVYIPLDGFDFF